MASYNTQQQESKTGKMSLIPWILWNVNKKSYVVDRSMSVLMTLS